MMPAWAMNAIGYFCPPSAGRSRRHDAIITDVGCQPSRESSGHSQNLEVTSFSFLCPTKASVVTVGPYLLTRKGVRGKDGSLVWLVATDYSPLAPRFCACRCLSRASWAFCRRSSSSVEMRRSSKTGELMAVWAMSVISLFRQPMAGRPFTRGARFPISSPLSQ